MNLFSRLPKSIKSLGRYLITFVIFGSTAVIALILARGNTFTPDGISPTGVIRIDIESLDNLQVFLDNQSKTLTSNQTLEGILPGNYSLRLQREGYSGWEQNIRVNAGLITDISVQLFPIDLKLKQIDAKNTSNIFYSQDRSRAFYLVTDSQLGTNIGIWQQDLTAPTFSFNPPPSQIKLSNINSLIKDAATTKRLELIPSTDNRKLLVRDGNNLYLIDTDRFNEPSRSNQIIVEYPVTQISWLSDSNNLLILSNNILIDYEISTGKSNIITYSETVPTFAYTTNTVYFIRSEQLFKYNAGRSVLVPLVNTSLPKDITNIFTASTNLSNLVLEANDNLYFLNIEQSILQTIGKFEMLSVSPNGNSLMVRDDKSIKSVTINVSQLLDRVEINIEPTAIPETINIASIMWAKNSSYLIYLTIAEPKKVFSADQRGDNIQVLVDDLEVVVNSLNIKATDNGLVLLVKEQEDRTNLYELGF
jgi:hypothetical protein